MKKICDMCQKEFNADRSFRRFCSRKCFQNFMHLFGRNPTRITTCDPKTNKVITLIWLPEELIEVVKKLAKENKLSIEEQLYNDFQEIFKKHGFYKKSDE